MAAAVRAAVALIGVMVVLGGVVAAAIEYEYGGSDDRIEYVIGHDAETGHAFVYGEDSELVYESDDVADAEAWVDRQRGGRNYTVPVLMVAGGTLLMMVMVIPCVRKSRSRV